ncbi:MAG: hypothetical protein HUJ76_06380 [Parasporobacterium sp.]|nr:hypothetical protein [Parasporobacterium sp.]
MNDKDKTIGHFRDLAQRSYSNSVYTFSCFLDENEQSILSELDKELHYAGVLVFGGFENAGRCIVRFGNEADMGYPGDFPITCIEIKPVNTKFGDTLTHRDYLGALMSLGIKRELLGDIITDGRTGWIFCMDHIADYIIENLTQIRHTNVTAARQKDIPENAGPKYEARDLTAASERADAVISKLFSLSRSRSIELFKAGKIFINSKTADNPAAVLKSGYVISVRGFGKFIYDGVTGITGKGNFRIKVRIFR